MVEIGQLNNKRAAQALSDFLQTKKINHQVEELQLEQDHQSILSYRFSVTAEDANIASELFVEFVSNPDQKKYLDASWQINRPQKGAVSAWGFADIWSSAGLITKFVTLLCVGVFIASHMGYFRAIMQSFSFSWNLSEPYRLLTPAFIHLSTLHIIFNLMWWWHFGRQIERLLGRQTLLLLLIGTAITANVAQAVLVSNHFAGLSGVVYGLAGFVWYCGFFHKSQTLFLPNNMFVFFVVWMMLGFFEVLPISMANWAHLFGLLSGLGLAALLVKREKA